METWFLVFFMAMMPGQDYNEIYQINTKFSSGEACRMYISDPYNNAVLKKHMAMTYPYTPVETVWCIRQDKLDEILQNEGKPV